MGEFELARGYTLAIVGLEKKPVSKEILKDHEKQVADAQSTSSNVTEVLKRPLGKIFKKIRPCITSKEVENKGNGRKDLSDRLRIT